MMKQLKKITLRLIAGGNVVTVLLMLLIGYSDRCSPVDHPVWSSMGIIFPLFLVINLVFLVFWLVFYWRGAIIPLAGFLLCYTPVRTYIPFNISQEPPRDAIKVLTYNVLMFAPWEADEEVAYTPNNPILKYIRESKADLVCLQEAGFSEIKMDIFELFKTEYPYCDSLKSKEGEVVAVMSKFPILKKERIDYRSVGNLSGAFELDIHGLRTVVINNHLETIGLSPEDKDNLNVLAHGDMTREEARGESRYLFKKMTTAVKKRGPQADAVADYVERCREEGKSVIVCGDLNDTPISYAHHRVGDGLTDCYAASGNGPGFSYNRGRLWVRIDHIFCSDEWEPFGCQVDQKVATSDHYPVYCWLKMHPKS